MTLHSFIELWAALYSFAMTMIGVYTAWSWVTDRLIKVEVLPNLKLSRKGKTVVYEFTNVPEDAGNALVGSFLAVVQAHKIGRKE